MVAWNITNFGGEIPRNRVPPDGMATQAWNCDLSSGALAGLPQPELLKDLSATTGNVRKAYRFPGPNPGDVDAWLPLPSEFSSVVRSPLANDTLHRIYWSNPPTTAQPGCYWNTYENIVLGNTGANAPYNMGFTSPDLTQLITVTSAGGSVQYQQASSAQAATAGTGYKPGDVLVAAGGVLSSGSALSATVSATTVQTITLAAGGSGAAADGVYVMSGTTGAGALMTFTGTVAGGALVAIDGIISSGAYTSNPSHISYEPVGGVTGLTGAYVALTMGVERLTTVTSGHYASPPLNPVSTAAVSGTGSGCTLIVVYDSYGVPAVTRSYLYTLLDEFGEESSPCTPSVDVDGAADGTWTVTGLPTTAPASPTGMRFPNVVKLRLYRTVTGSSGAANFYQVVDLTFGAATYTDTILDAVVVNNNTLFSTRFLPPLANMDGLTSFPGGMLVGFTGNTIHFCEPDRPNAWPAGYDQSLQYQIQGFGVWQNTLVVLTTGFPSTGSGSSPGTFIFSQVQVPEPCISRGSIITDLMGVYYASQNGLVMLNYFGMTNQTLSNITKNQWLTTFLAGSIVACRHRSQYLAINGTGVGFLIDYTEPRMGVVHLNTFNNAVCVWNDVYTGDAYIIADKIVYRWDSPTTAPLTYRWRSKDYLMAAPTSLGACQIEMAQAVEVAPPAVTPPLLSNGDTSLILPAGANAVFNLYAGSEARHLICSKVLTKAQSIFRLPSGAKIFNFEVEIIAQTQVYSIQLASTMHELKNV